MPSRRRSARKPPDCWEACRARCRRWWRRSRSPPARPRAGFDWENAEQVLEKLDEELGRVRQARRNAAQDELEDELGDMLFVLVNLARFVKVDPEQALRRTNAKFRTPLRLCRSQPAASRASKPADATIDEMEALVAGSEEKCAIEIRAVIPARRNSPRLSSCRRRIWSFADIELLPVRFSVVANKVGGHVFGAFDGARMVGFCFAIPGHQARRARPYLHSHMLGVLPEYRNRGWAAC